MVTLNDLKVGKSDKVCQQVIDTFRRESQLMDAMEFDDCMEPSTGSSTLTYGYMRTVVPSMAGFRELNQEYEESTARREKITTELKIFGGEYKIDRVIAEASGMVDEVAYQCEEKIKGTINLFHNTIINGDSAKDSKTFDGLDVILAGTSTELIPNEESGIIDLSTSSAIDKNYSIMLDAMEEFLASLSGTPSFIMGNTKVITKLKSVARRAGYLTHSEDAFGKSVDGYAGVPFLNLGDYVTVTEEEEKEVPIIPIGARTINGTSIKGLTDIYAVVLGRNKLHGVTLSHGNLITSRIPDFRTAGAVKPGDVEMVAAIALKDSRAAGVLRNIKVI